MIDTIMFDLDGTLLQFHQNDFVPAYFKELSKTFVKLKLDPELAIKAVWAGTKAMVINDGSRINSQCFWETFAKIMNIDEKNLIKIETATDSFYMKEFDSVKFVMKPSELPKRMLHSLKNRGFTLVLATNPLFPLCSIETRLKWIGLTIADFKLVTHYSNSTYCKPNIGYFQEIFNKIEKNPSQCLMIGNHSVEDMSVGELGTETFLVTDYLETSDLTGRKISELKPIHKGTLLELDAYLRDCL